jgi:hypothetical protein
MTKTKRLSAVVILSVAIATPVLAQEEAGVLGPGSRNGLEPQPEPTYHYSRGLYYENGFAPFDEMHSRSWLERSKPGGRSTARRSPGN